MTGPVATATTRSSRRTRWLPRQAARPVRRRPRTTCSRSAAYAALRHRQRPATRGSALDTGHIRDDPHWRVAGRAGPGLEDRRVEITGPTDPKMTINALNSGAKVWLADQEDATSPTWANVIEGQLTLRDAIRGDARLHQPRGQGVPAAVTARATCPRSWSARAAGTCREAPALHGPRPAARAAASASLVDFGLYFFHNAAAADRARPRPVLLPAQARVPPRRRGCGTTSSRSRRSALGIPHGTIRATVLIETIPAAFEMEEILYELRDHCAGLNAGRWDYIFSIIKNFRARGDAVRAARPRAGHDDRAVHARLHRAARRDLPQARRASPSAA